MDATKSHAEKLLQHWLLKNTTFRYILSLAQHFIQVSYLAKVVDIMLDHAV